MCLPVLILLGSLSGMGALSAPAIEPANSLSTHPELLEQVKPWIGLVEVGGDPVCGGALIDKFWVVTARHCVRSYCDAIDPDIRVNFTVDWDDPHFLYAKDVSCFPSLDPLHDDDLFHDDNLSNDLALIRVAKVRRDPAKFPTLAEVSAAQGGTVIGWSSCDSFRKQAHVLNMAFQAEEIAEPLLASKELCPYVGSLQTGQFVAGSTADGPCLGLQQGDSGSPLIQIVDGRPVLVGIASEQCTGNGLAVFEDVARYRTWIAREICQWQRYRGLLLTRKQRYRNCMERILGSFP